MSFPEKPKPTNKKLPDAIYLKDLSTDSLEVLQHFGIESPALLNKYCCALEDALIEQVKHKMILQEDNQRLRDLLKQNKIEDKDDG